MDACASAPPRVGGRAGAGRAPVQADAGFTGPSGASRSSSEALPHRLRRASYWVGKLFGGRGRRLIPQVSPGKTLAGFLGGAAATIAVGFLFHFAIPQVGRVHVLALAALITLTGPMGDLVISVIKRDRGVKDMGTILPGHGGVLDRFDSILYTTPIYYFALAVLGLRR